MNLSIESHSQIKIAIVLFSAIAVHLWCLTMATVCLRHQSGQMGIDRRNVSFAGEMLRPKKLEFSTTCSNREI